MKYPLVSRTYLDNYLKHGDYDLHQKRHIRFIVREIWQTLSQNKQCVSQNDNPELFLVVGPPGSGKSTLLERTLSQELQRRDSVVIDQDAIRSYLSPNLTTHLDHLPDITPEQLDIAWREQWRPAQIYATLSLLNLASRNRFSIMRCGRAGGKVTAHLCSRAEKAGYHLRSAVVLAPFRECAKSIASRQETTGRPVNSLYIKGSWEEIPDGVRTILQHSDRVDFYWRDAASSSAVLAGEIERGGSLQRHLPKYMRKISNICRIDL